MSLALSEDCRRPLSLVRSLDADRGPEHHRPGQFGDLAGAQGLVEQLSLQRTNMADQVDATGVVLHGRVAQRAQPTGFRGMR